MNYRHLRWPVVVFGLALGVGFSACAGTETPSESGQQAQAATRLPDRFERTLPWGEADDELGLRPAVAESIAYGPNAVAVTTHGVLLLDRLKQRVVMVDDAHALRTVAKVSEDNEDLVAGTDGAFVAYSPVRARASFYDANGAPAGELSIPRALTNGVRLSLGISRRLSLVTGYQEQIAIGSPAAPMALSVSLAAKREGAHVLADGRGVVVRVEDGAGTLEVVSQPTEQERSAVVGSVALPGSMTAARVVGGDASTVCLRTEQVAFGAKLSVSRRALCVSTKSWKVVLDQALPAVGLYVPRTEVAYGDGHLAVIRPTEAGLEVSAVRVVRTEVSQ
ncbi:MAG: hypothetical protein KC776_16900 [Myxococcales bacterium]|nr:hypothetical protein [Myxococcales bacterium]MCB9575510.1 hypothetical protein [Polyangiaceae bacterium]